MVDLTIKDQKIRIDMILRQSDKDPTMVAIATVTIGIFEVRGYRVKKSSTDNQYYFTPPRYKTAYKWVDTARIHDPEIWIEICEAAKQHYLELMDANIAKGGTESIDVDEIPF